MNNNNKIIKQTLLTNKSVDEIRDFIKTNQEDAQIISIDIIDGYDVIIRQNHVRFSEKPLWIESYDGSLTINLPINYEPYHNFYLCTISQTEELIKAVTSSKPFIRQRINGINEKIKETKNSLMELKELRQKSLNWKYNNKKWMNQINGSSIIVL